MSAPASPAPPLATDPTPDQPAADAPAQPALRLRPASPLDAGRLGAMITASRAAQPWMPALHSAAEDIAFAGMMIDRGWVTVALLDDTPAGFLARDGSYIHSLYIAPFAQGQGAGAALLSDAKTHSETLDLWTFQANRGAQRFYRREGFRPTEETNGANNEEGLPDVRFQWARPPQPSANKSPNQMTGPAPDRPRAKGAPNRHD